MKSRTIVIIAIAVAVVVIVSVLCLVVFREKEKLLGVDGFYALSMSPWNKTTGLNASAHVLSMSHHHIKWNDITWKLYNVTTANTVPATFTHQDTNSDGYLDINEWVTVVAPCHGSYQVRAIHNESGGILYVSESFVM